MELTVLGKYGPYPPAGGATSGYLLTEGRTNLLLDCGSGVLSRLQEKLPLSALSAVVLSHLHSDHMADILVLRYALQTAPVREAMVYWPIKVFAPAKPAAEYDLLRGSGVFELIPVADGMKARLGELDLEFWEMTHPVPSFGVRVTGPEGVLAYTGDTNENDRLEAFVGNASTLLADTGLMARDKGGPAAAHLTAREVGELARKTEVPRLICTHLGPKMSEEAVLCEVGYPGAFVAKERETYRIGPK